MADPYSSPPGGYPYSGPPGYQQGYQPYGYQQPRGTNGMAIASLVVSCASLLVCTLLGAVGAILGHMAKKQIAETGEDGDGLATAGIIIGWALTGLSVLGILLFVFFIVLGASSGV